MALVKSNPSPLKNWLSKYGFLAGLFCMVPLAYLYPQGGSRNGTLHPEILSSIGIALILFLQGLSLAFEKIKMGISNWRLHLIIQSFTFVIFPIVGVLLSLLLPKIWASVPQGAVDGFLYLCVLPSTVSTSVVLTSVAGGNTAGALFNAAFSNIIGVVITPILVHLLMQGTGENQPFLPLLTKITLLTLLPFAVGMLLRPMSRQWVESHKSWVNRISNGIILFIVYCAFADSFQAQIWETFGWVLTAKVLVIVIALFTFISWFVSLSSASLGLNRADLITAYFCSVKKTLAMGVPLAMLIFGVREDLSLILLPIMFYHPLQLFVNGILANAWAQNSPK